MDIQNVLGNIESIIDRQTALEQVKKDGTFLKQLSPELKKDKEFVIAALNQNPIAILFADESLRKDEDVMQIVKGAIKDAMIQNPISILLADESFISNDDVLDIITEAMDKTNLLKNNNSLEEIRTSEKIEVSITDGNNTEITEVNFILVEANKIEEINPPKSYAIKETELLEFPIGDPDTNFQRGFAAYEEDDMTYLERIQSIDTNKYIAYDENSKDPLDVYINIDEETAKIEKEKLYNEIKRIKDEIKEENKRLVSGYENKKEANYDEMVKNLIKLNPMNLKLASDKVKDDFITVLNAVINNGLSLEFASDRLKDNLIIAATATVMDRNAIRFASPRVQIEDDILVLLEIEDATMKEKIDYLLDIIERQEKMDELENIKDEVKEVARNINTSENTRKL